MRRLKQSRPNESLDEYRVAAQLYARDQRQLDRTEQRRALCDAAVELGLPAEYLHRAAVILRARRMARARWRRDARQALQFAATIASMLWLGRHSVTPSDDVIAPLAPRHAASVVRNEAGRPPVPPPSGTCFPVDIRRWTNHPLTRPMLNIPGNDLSRLAAGVHKLSGVPFRTDRAILVGPGETGAPGIPVQVPRRVSGIRVGRKADRRYFLHGAHFVFPVMQGVKIGTYVIYYADGTRQRVPIRAGIEVGDWWETGAGATKAAVAWTGNCAAAAGAGISVRLFMLRWENPRPSATISRLEIVTGDQPAGIKMPAPFLVGVTTAQDSRDRSAGLPGIRRNSPANQVRGNLLVSNPSPPPNVPHGRSPFSSRSLSPHW